VVAIVKPIGRQSADWFDINVAGWTEDQENAIAAEKMKNLAIMDTIDSLTQIFEEDGTHLTKKSGAVYINYMMELGKQMPINTRTNEKDPRTQETQEMETDNQKRTMTKQGNDKDTIEERLDKLEEAVNAQSKNLHSSNIAIRKIREEIDAEINERKMDMLVISGVRPSSRWLHKDNVGERNEWLRKQAIQAIKS
jgi:hypothetical protein